MPPANYDPRQPIIHQTRCPSCGSPQSKHHNAACSQPCTKPYNQRLIQVAYHRRIHQTLYNFKMHATIVTYQPLPIPFLPLPLTGVPS